MLTDTIFDFKTVLVNVEITIEINTVAVLFMGN